QTVTQPTADIAVKEGESVTLHCTYSTGYPTLMWYLQDTSKAIHFILHDQSKSEHLGPGFRGRFSAAVSRAQRSFPLTISKSELEDSALYYCVLRDTMLERSYTGAQKPR
ncbi:hypothetical protein FKM82_017202, partial [Ascaphus truei]